MSEFWITSSERPAETEAVWSMMLLALEGVTEVSADLVDSFGAAIIGAFDSGSSVV